MLLYFPVFRIYQVGLVACCVGENNTLCLVYNGYKRRLDPGSIGAACLQGKEGARLE